MWQVLVSHVFWHAACGWVDLHMLFGLDVHVLRLLIAMGLSWLSPGSMRFGEVLVPPWLGRGGPSRSVSEHFLVSKTNRFRKSDFAV